MYILGIESSCDETSIAIMDIQRKKVIKNIVSTQIDTHKEFGGVIPEIASRLHVNNFPFVLKKAISGIDISKIKYIVYTNNPGLIGSLQIGMLVANAIGQALNIPIYGVDHIIGHIYASGIENEIMYPALSLVTSGGHTQLVELSSPNKYNVLGETQDDAIGEVFDKVGRKMGLSYPAGPKIDKLSQKGIKTINFPIAKTISKLDFSFSGLKSAVINYINTKTQKKENLNLYNLSASFQFAAITAVLEKTKHALKLKKYATLILAGGVASNTFLRIEIVKLHKNTLIPKMEYCTDNAAMICNAFIETKLR